MVDRELGVIMIFGIISGQALGGFSLADEFYDNVELLLDFGREADAATQVTDLSKNASTVSFGGAAEVDDLTQIVGGNTLKLAATNDRLYVADHAGLSIASSDFTIEAVINLNTIGRTNCIANKRGAGADNKEFSFAVNSSNQLAFTVFTSVGGISMTSTTTLSAGVDYEVCAQRKDSTNWRLFIDGVSAGTMGTSRAALENTDEFRIGRDGYDYSRYFDGWIGPFRYTKGVARYPDTGYTPLTAPFSLPVTHPAHLDLVDMMTMNDVVGSTVNGEKGLWDGVLKNGASISAATGLLGDCALFAGSNDRLEMAGLATELEAIGTTTISFQFKRSVAPSSSNALFDCASSTSANGGYVIRVSTNGGIGIQCKTTGGTHRANILGTTNICDNTWHTVSVQITHTVSEMVRIFIDGVLEVEIALSGTFTVNVSNMYIGDGRAWNDFWGSLDMIRFFNRALTEDEHNELHVNRAVDHWA